MQKKILNLLRSLEKTQKIYWNIPKELGLFLNILIKDRNYKKILEIGSSNGYSGIWIAEALSHTNGKLYTIESHKKKRFYLAEENFKKSGLTKYIQQILGHAPEAIPNNPKLFDMAFFDATKYEHIDYFNTIKDRIKKHGLIITDNINSHKKEFCKYTKTLKNDQNWKSIKLNIGQGILISKKIQ